MGIVALTTYIGVFLSAKKKRRSLLFSELYEFNERLLLNFKFGKKPLDKVAEGFRIIPLLLKGEYAADGADGIFLNEYLKNLGSSDALSQIDYLNAKSAQLARYRDESAEEYKKYSSLYIKIFFMIGVLAAVLLA